MKSYLFFSSSIFFIAFSATPPQSIESRLLICCSSAYLQKQYATQFPGTNYEPLAIDTEAASEYSAAGPLSARRGIDPSSIYNRRSNPINIVDVRKQVIPYLEPE